ncbi:transcriptional regulator PpsR [Variovorax sp. J22R133]|uniref:transcriptional regulator PpsR n=1 Tax=Variovorax brevis TaxID=3053503 RepID=UPI0025779548|nr:transcriptional regulator PpsR [Variovorax sp. J22R133]MDM0113803.1 transcriptional regulator PpsR [Variovorax sp. J22R133]
MSFRPGDLPDLAALAVWAPELARTFVSLSSDIALVMDSTGVIRSVVQGDGEPLAPLAHDWVGRRWADTVSEETRPKIENLLQEVAANGIGRRREVNHPFHHGVSIPVAYTAIRFGAEGPVLATGRDLRAIAAIQQRFLESQQEMERGYWKVRQDETRYRLLFQVATDAVLVVDGRTLRILEANQAAAQMFDFTSEQLIDRPATVGFEERSRVSVEELLISARASGQSAEIRARLVGKITLTSVAATPFRADDAMRLLVRVRAVDALELTTALSTSLARMVDDSSDGVVVTDSSGRVLVANPAFLNLVRLNSEAQVKGLPIMDWLGMPDRPLATLLPQVRKVGLVRRIKSWVKVAHTPVAQVEISAALLTEGDQECIGFTIHRAPQALNDESSPYEFNLAIQQLLGRLGQVPFAELMAEAAIIAEHHFIQGALAQSQQDAAGAAALLGMSEAELAGRRLGDPTRRPGELPGVD